MKYAIVEQFIDDRWEFFGLFKGTPEEALIHCHQENECSTLMEMSHARPFVFNEEFDGWTYGNEFDLEDGTDLEPESEDIEFRACPAVAQTPRTKPLKS